MTQYLFGAGELWGTATQDAGGNALSLPTPVKFGTLQEVSVEIAFDTKLLYGQSQFALAAARGKGTIKGKAKAASLNGALLNSIFFGQTVAAGLIGDVDGSSASTIPATPYEITPTVPSGGAWVADLGVRNASGVPMTRVASGPASGQYAVSAGVYTFAAADTGLTVYIAYQYSAASTTARNATVANLAQGPAPAFRADLYAPYGAKQLVLTLPFCIANKLSLATKIDDFVIPEFDFDALADSNGNVMTWALSE